MKPSWSVLFPAMIAGSISVHGADVKSDVKTAAQKLADKSNYSWTSTPKFEGPGLNWRQGPTQGKTERGEFTFITLTVNDTPIEAAFKGDKSAIKRQTEWESADEIEGGTGRVARRLKAFQAPAAEAEDLLAKTKELKKGSAGLYSGALTAEGVKELFARSQRGRAEATDTKGSVKFWTKDGVLTKYEFYVHGKLTPGKDQQEVEINLTTTVEIKDVGSTKVIVPEEAKKKLS